jgi:cation diffusion facilitator family transporter
MAAGGGTKAIIAALLANAGIAVAKFGGFVITGSSSMLAESVHSVADSGNQALLLLGQRRARREATPQHPFGYGRERYFWAFVVALVLFTLGSVFSIYEGIHKLQHPEDLESAGVAIGILVIAIILECFSFRTAIVEANHVRHGEGWISFIRHSRAPELPVVLLEDLGALVGLILALGGVSLTIVTDDPVWDAIGTICIGTLLGIIAIVLVIEMKSLLIGEGAKPSEEQQIRALIEGTEHVNELIHMRTEYLGPDELLVGAKVAFDHDLSIPELARAVDALEQRVRGEFRQVGPMYIEPDVVRKP